MKPTCYKSMTFCQLLFAKTLCQNLGAKEHLQARHLWRNKSLLFPGVCFFFIVSVTAAEICCSAHVFCVSLCKKSTLSSESLNIQCHHYRRNAFTNQGPSIGSVIISEHVLLMIACITERYPRARVSSAIVLPGRPVSTCCVSGELVGCPRGSGDGAAVATINGFEFPPRVMSLFWKEVVVTMK